MEEATKLASTLPSSSEVALRMKKVLAPPVFQSTSQESRSEIQSDFRWLRERAKKFSGRWVALRNGKLLAATENFNDLVDEVRSNQLDVTLYHRC